MHQWSSAVNGVTQKLQWQSLIMQDPQRQKPNPLNVTMASTDRIWKLENQLQKRSLSFFAISQRRYAMDWLRRMANKLTMSLHQQLQQENQFGASRVLHSRLQADSGNPNRELQETSHHSRRQSSF